MKKIIARFVKEDCPNTGLVTVCIAHIENPDSPSQFEVFVSRGLLANGSESAIFDQLQIALVFASTEIYAAFEDLRAKLAMEWSS